MPAGLGSVVVVVEVVEVDDVDDVDDVDVDDVDDVEDDDGGFIGGIIGGTIGGEPVGVNLDCTCQASNWLKPPIDLTVSVS